MTNGYGPVCAASLGLTGSTLDIGYEGPDLLDLLASVAPLSETTPIKQPP
jgi:hypothetical protein